MFIIFALLVLALIVFAPSWWVKRVLNKYNAERPDLNGTGGELAQHFVERFELPIRVNQQGPDSYDSHNKCVNLSDEYFNQKSLTAVAVAAHEIGHAIQDKEEYSALSWRFRIVVLSSWIQKISSFLLMLSPLLFLVPSGGVFFRVIMLVALVGAVVGFLAHLITLPVEFDASFGKALPILKEGNYVHAEDLVIIRKILFACALTYLAVALRNMLNLGYWLRVLRR